MRFLLKAEMAMEASNAAARHGDLPGILQSILDDQKPDDTVLPWHHPTYRQLYDDWHRIRKTAGLARIVPHNFRSTAASQLLANGASTVALRDYLGHSNTSVLEKHYANVLGTMRGLAETREAANGRKRGRKY